MKPLPFVIYYVPQVGTHPLCYVMHHKRGGITSASDAEVLMYRRLGLKITKAPKVKEYKPLVTEGEP